MSILVGSARVAVIPDASDFGALLKARIQEQIRAHGKPEVPVGFDVDQASLARARAATMAAFGKAATVKVTYSLDAASVAKVRNQQRVLFKDAHAKVRYEVDPAGVVKATAAQDALAKATSRTATAVTRSYRPWILTGTVLRWVVAGATEFAAVAVPAFIAGASAAAALAPAFDDIAAHSKATVTAYGDLGEAQGRVSGSTTKLISQFDRVAESVRPGAFELYGSAVGIAGKQMGTFTHLAQSSVAVLDRFSAKLHLESASGAFGKFMGAAVPDFVELGQVAGNTAHALVNLLAAAPGLAEALLKVADGASHLLLIATEIPAPILTMVLALEEAHRWGGLTSTVFGKLSKSAGKLPGPFSKLGEGAKFLTKVPVPGWAIASAAVLGGMLFYALLKSGDAADHLVRHMEDLTQQAKNTQVLDLLAGNIHTLARSQAEAATAARNNARSVAGIRNEYGRFSSALRPTSGDLDTYTHGLAKQRAQLGNVIQGAAYLMRTYGLSFPQALAFADQANVKLAKGITGTSKAAQIARQQFRDLAAGIENTTVPAGRLGDDIMALEAATEQEASQIPKLNAAWDQFTQTSQGAETAFVTLAEAVRQTMSGLQAKDPTSLAGKFTTLEKAAKLTDASFGGTNKASLQLQQQFQMTAGDIQPLIDSLRLAKLRGGDFRQAVVDMVAPLWTLAHGNRAARAELMVFAREAGIDTPAQLQRLIDRVGSTRAATADLKRITDKATIADSDLVKASADLNNTLQQLVAQGMDKAKFAAFGIQKAINTYTQDLHDNREVTAKGSHDRAALIHDLEKAGLTARQARAQVDAFTRSVSHIKPVRQVLIDVHGHGRWNVTSGFAPGTASRAAAGGGIVPGPAGDGDTHVARVRPGEGILVPEAVRAVGGPSTVIAWNRKFGTGRKSTGMAYAGGGVFGTYSDGAPGLGRWADREYALTVTALEKAVAAGVTRALSTAAVGASGRMASRGLVRAEQMYALSLFGRYGWGPEQLPPLIALWNRESGWNPNAVNPASGAAGIPQALGHGHVFDLGDWRRQIGWGEGYISGRYGSPAGAWAHEQAVGWYVGGTKRAAPGWAWVGERGPELAWLRGGEVILPAGVSARVGGSIGRGYATGTGLTAEQTSGLSLFDAYVKSGILTIARVLTEQKQFLHDIARFYSGPALQWRDAAVGRQTRAMESTARKIESLDARVAAARQYQQSVRSGLSGYAALSGITLDPFANRRGLAAGIETNLRQKLAQLRRFAGALTALHHAKMSPAIIREVVDMGPDDGYTYAQALLAGGASVIRQLNATEAAIGREERSVARTAAVAVYGRGVVDGLKGERAALEREMRHLGRVLGLEAARWFKVPRSKLPKHFADGGWAAAGSLAVVGEEGEELALFGQAARIIPAGQFEVRTVSADQIARPAPSAGTTTNYVANITRANQADVERAFHVLEVRSAMKLRIGRNS